MKTKEFLSILKEQGKKELIFEFLPGQMVGANYHITEVKNTHIDAVDCGGRADAWNETVVQLWESPSEKDKTNFLLASKALSILDRVNSMRPMDQEAIIRFEYGNDSFHTAQLFVKDTLVKEDALVISLSIAPTACKAEELCGVSVDTQKELATSCSPGAGCC
ncbi:DUF6428 family protein [Muriicola sp.]|uniref:DUF6428 family protein n=1 Tax=Muriicola sp. TaxID=2020856 RepID=UPI003C773792